MKTKMLILVVATLQLVACETVETTDVLGNKTKSSHLDPNAGALIGKGLDVLGNQRKAEPDYKNTR